MNIYENVSEIIGRTPLVRLSKLEKEWGKKIKLELKVDKSILGGIILRTENSQTDASVRSRLDSIRSQIASNEF